MSQKSDLLEEAAVINPFSIPLKENQPYIMKNLLSYMRKKNNILYAK